MNLVREYVACMDEISQIYSIYEQKLDFLDRLRKNCGLLEDEHNVASAGQKKAMIEQIDWAVNQLRSNHEGLPRTLHDLRNSLDDVSSQARSSLTLVS